MFEKKRCYLCGGKLVNGYCPECGLDNTRRERIRYRLNHSSKVEGMNESRSADYIDSKDEKERIQSLRKKEHQHEKLHEQLKKERQHSKLQQSVKNGYERGASLYKETAHKRADMLKSKKGTISAQNKGRMTVAIIGIIVAIVSMAGEYLYKETSDIESTPEYEVSENVEYESDPYEYVTRELAEDGEAFQTNLQQGFYQVGVHLPEGTYTVEIEEGDASVSVEDIENGIYLYQYFSRDGQDTDTVAWKDDIRLYQGANVEISGNGQLLLTTQNGQVKDKVFMLNPLSEQIQVDSGQTLTAGTDFPAGVYDVSVDNNWTVFYYSVLMSDSAVEELMIAEENEGEWRNEYNLWLDAEDNSRLYKNVVLPEGTQIWTENEPVLMTPSEAIASTDYASYYKY